MRAAAADDRRRTPPARLGPVREWLLALDPEGARKHLALRATATGALSALVLSALAARLGLPPAAAMLGPALAMMAVTTLADPGPRAQRATLVLATLPAAAALVLGALSGARTWLPAALFLGTVFLSVLAQRRGPRGVTLGLAAFNAFFFALFFRAQPAQLPGQLASLAVSTGVALVVHALLVPDAPARALRRSERALPALASRLLGALARLAAGESLLRWRALRAGVQRLTEAALVLEDLAVRTGAPDGAALRARVFGLELAAGRVVAGALDVLREGPDPQRRRAGLALALRLARGAVRGEPGAAGRALAHVRALGRDATPPVALAAERLAVALEELLGCVGRGGAGAAAGMSEVLASAGAASVAREAEGGASAPPTLAGAASTAHRAEGTARSAHPAPDVARGGPEALAAPGTEVGAPDAARGGREAPATPGAEAGAPDAPVRSGPDAPPTPASRGGLHPTTRKAVQATLACALAIGLGRLISEERWLWAVIAAYLVVARPVTRGEIFARAWQRTLGTVAGVALGMLLAAAVHGHPRVELALLLVCVFFAFHALRGGLTWMVLWFTAVLALLFGLQGLYSPQLLYLRIAETVAGVVLGAGVAALVLPVRTGSAVRDALAAVLARAHEALGALGQGAPGLAQVRAVDHALRRLRAVAEPLTRGPLPLATGTVQLVHDAGILVFYVRQLATPALLDAAVRAHPPLRERLLRAAQEAHHLAAALEDGAPAGEPAHASAPHVPSAPAPPGAALAAHWLHRVEETQARLARLLRPRDAARA